MSGSNYQPVHNSGLIMPNNTWTAEHEQSYYSDAEGNIDEDAVIDKSSDMASDEDDDSSVDSSTQRDAVVPPTEVTLPLSRPPVAALNPNIVFLVVTAKENGKTDRSMVVHPRAEPSVVPQQSINPTQADVVSGTNSRTFFLS